MKQGVEKGRRRRVLQVIVGGIRSKKKKLSLEGGKHGGGFFFGKVSRARRNAKEKWGVDIIEHKMIGQSQRGQQDTNSRQKVTTVQQQGR